MDCNYYNRVLQAVPRFVACESSPIEYCIVVFLNLQKVKQVPSTLPTITTQPTSPFQKLLFSATMTYNPEHLATLSLRQPKLFTVADILDSKYSHDADMAFTLPAQLEESVAKCSLKNKPLVLLHLVTSEELSSLVSKVLCFTNSREATHRYDVVQGRSSAML